jgi:hypothetical protein
MGRLFGSVGVDDSVLQLGQRAKQFSASIRSLIAAQEEHSCLVAQQEQHYAALRSALRFALAIAVACAVLLVLRGVVLGLTELFGSAWLASIASGLLVLAAFVFAFLAATVVLARRRQRELDPPRAPSTARRKRVATTRHTLF